MVNGRNRGQRAREFKRTTGNNGSEEEYLDRREDFMEVQAFYEDLGPRVAKLLRVGDVQGLLEEMGMAAVVTLMDIMKNGRGKEKRAAASELMYMSLGKPVQRSVSVYGNIGSFSDKQLNSMIKSYESRLPDKYKNILDKEFPEVKRD